ncbi:MAG TPA: AAA family ATPase [Desulfuromonadales bacterium]|nr:AAA family ATPase [Desulfuromonadales bacterium]
MAIKIKNKSIHERVDTFTEDTAVETISRTETGEAAAAAAEQSVVSPPEQPDPFLREELAEVVDRSKLGWYSPTYSASRSIVLDPEVLHANRCLAFDGDALIIDSYKVLRAQILQRMKQTSGNTLMVTSVLPGEGKTTTAINLALIMAKEFQQTVLLVDCDLQQQDIHKRLGYPSDKGLINYLLDDCPVADLFTWPGIEKILLVSGGRTIRDSSELLGSPRMKELVTDMKTRYPNRLIIFDMQSTFAGADTLVFAPLVDNILLVVQEGHSSAKEINRAIDSLPGEKLIGLMLNRHRAATHIVPPRSARKIKPESGMFAHQKHMERKGIVKMIKRLVSRKRQ